MSDEADGIPHRRHVHRQPRPAHRRRAEGVKTTAFDLQLNPAHPSLQFHKLDKAKDRAILVGPRQRDIRLIVHRTERACCSATSTTTTRPMTGPSGGSSRRIPRPARRSSWRFARRCRRSRSQVRRGGAARRLRSRRLFAGISDDELLGYGVPAEWLADVRSANEDTLLDWRIICPRSRRGAAGAGHRRRRRRSRQAGRRRRRSVRASRRPAPLPRDEQRRGTGARARLPVGEMDGLPASGAAHVGGARLQRPGARVGLGGHGQDHRGAASRGLPGPGESGRPGAADHVLRHAGECAADEAPAADQQRAAARRADRSSFDERDRPAALRAERRPAADRIP